MMKFIKQNKFPLIIFGVSLITGIVAGFYLASINPFAYDVDGFGKDAANFADHFNFNGSIRRPPLYPFLLGVVYFVFGNFNQTALIVFHSIVLSLTGVMVFRISRKIYKSEVLAFITGLAFSINPFSLWYVPYYFIALIFTFLTVATVWMGYRAYKSGKIIDAVIYGLIMGITTLGKGVMLLFPFSLLASLIVFKLLGIKPLRDIKFPSLFRTSLVAIVAMFMVIMPWAIRNKNVSDKWVLVSSNAGVEFFRGNVFADEDSYKLKNGLGPILSKSFRAEENYLDSIGVHDSTEVVLDSIFNPMMKDYMVKTPGKFAIKLLKQIPSFWTLASDYKSSVLRLIIAFILIFSFFGGFIRQPNLFNFIILITVIYFNLVYAAVYACARYSFPLYPLLMIPGIYFIYNLLPKKFIKLFRFESSKQ